MNRRRFLQALFAVPCLGAPSEDEWDAECYWAAVNDARGEAPVPYAALLGEGG